MNLHVFVYFGESWSLREALFQIRIVFILFCNPFEAGFSFLVISIVCVDFLSLRRNKERKLKYVPEYHADMRNYVAGKHYLMNEAIHRQPKLRM